MQTLRSGDRPPLLCKMCERPAPLMASEFLLDGTGNPDICDWQGRLWGTCIDHCGFSGITATQFKRETNRAWERYKNEGRRKASARSADFHNIGQMFREKYPELTSGEYREMARERCVKAAQRFLDAAAKAGENHKKAGEAIYAQYKEDIQQGVDDPLFQPPVRAWTLSPSDASFLTSFGPGMFIAYCCRSQKCRHYGMNSEWVCAKSSWHFKCPMCLRLYTPWTDKAMVGLPPLKFQYVMGLHDPITQEPMLLPVIWPPSREFSWILSMAEAHARNLDHVPNLEAFLSRTSVELSKLLQQEAIPASFVNKAWVHGDRPGLPGDWQWEHLAKGFHGNTWPIERVNEPGFKDFDLLIPLVGNMIYAGREISRL